MQKTLTRAGIFMLALGFVMAVLATTASARGRYHHRKHHKPRSQTEIVLPGDMQLPPDLTTTQKTWYFYDDNTNTPSTAELPGTYEFVNDNGSDSNGSVEFNLGGGEERWNLATNQLAGTDLDDLKKLKFDLFTPSSSAGGADTTLFVNFDVDFDKTSDEGYQGRLVYVPQQNGTPALDTWETWDMIDKGEAVWWWSGFAGNTPESSWPDGNTDEYRSWEDILDAFPKAEVFDEDFTGNFLVRAGHSGPEGLQGNVDNIVFGTKYKKVTYDFEAVYPTSGEILEPDEGERVSKRLHLKAKYDDGNDENDDAVQWAVRQGTCAVGTNTVFGNVDGHDDEFEWDGEKFSSKLDIRAMDEGEYCFIFNPTDDAGENDVRETQTFYIKAYAPDSFFDCFRHWDDYLNPSFDDKGECIEYVLENGNHWHHWGWWFWGWHRR